MLRPGRAGARDRLPGGPGPSDGKRDRGLPAPRDVRRLGPGARYHRQHQEAGAGRQTLRHRLSRLADHRYGLQEAQGPVPRAVRREVLRRPGLPARSLQHRGRRDHHRRLLPARQLRVRQEAQDQLRGPLSQDLRQAFQAAGVPAERSRLRQGRGSDRRHQAQHGHARQQGHLERGPAPHARVLPGRLAAQRQGHRQDRRGQLADRVLHRPQARDRPRRPPERPRGDRVPLQPELHRAEKARPAGPEILHLYRDGRLHPQRCPVARQESPDQPDSPFWRPAPARARDQARVRPARLRLHGKAGARRHRRGGRGREAVPGGALRRGRQVPGPHRAGGRPGLRRHRPGLRRPRPRGQLQLRRHVLPGARPRLYPAAVPRTPVPGHCRSTNS